MSRSKRAASGSTADLHPHSSAGETLSPLSPPVRGALALCLLICLLFFALDSLSRISTVEKISGISLTDVPPYSQPIPEGSWEEHWILPGSSMDARWWVIHARSMLETGQWRIRMTDRDNAPDGREVHWSSLLLWLLAGLASVLSLGNGKPAVANLPEAALFAGPLLLLLLLGGLIYFVIWRFGRSEGIFFGVVFLTSYPLISTYQAGEADHHGIVVAFAIASLLCLVAGGAGQVDGTGRRSGKTSSHSGFLEEARFWFKLSGFFGAAALWVSASTAIPVLVGTAAGACLSAFSARLQKQGDLLQPELWKTWAVSGCLTSIGFYLLEYSPNWMGWRLEVNHPLYALAWLGGGFLLQQVVAFIAKGGWEELSVKNLFRPESVRAWFPWVPVALLLAVLPAIGILFYSSEIFWVTDSFLLMLHKEYILEFQTLPVMIQRAGGSMVWMTHYPWPVFVVASSAILAWKKGWDPNYLRAILLVAPAVLIMQALAINQVRWSSAAFAMWSVAALVIFLNCRSAPASPRRVWTIRGAVVFGWVAVLVTLFPQMMTTFERGRTCLDAPIKQDDGNAIILRDIAHRFLRSSAEQVPVVLTGPNSSTDLAYHGGIQTLGTLYWENMPGLKRAAQIFSAKDEAGALAEIQAAGITHLVIPSWDNFVEAYAKLAAKEELGDGKAPFFETLLKEENCPLWLRPFAYPIPTDSGLDTNSVKIFAVLPQQSRFEHSYFLGVFFFENGQMDQARERFRRAAEMRGGHPGVESYLREIDRISPPTEQTP